jgi:hypothetical protein
MSADYQKRMGLKLAIATRLGSAEIVQRLSFALDRIPGD